MEQRLFEIEHIHYSKIEPNEWNPNQMAPEEFKQLVKGIKEAGGCDDPVLLVSLDNGRYKIVDGEHRYKGTIEAGFQLIPSIVRTQQEWDTERQKIETIRRQVIKGKFDKKKFTNLADILSNKLSSSRNDLASTLGFKSESHFLENYSSNKEDIKRVVSEYHDKKIQPKKEVDEDQENIRQSLKTIVSENSESISNGYAFFFFNGEMNFYLNANQSLIDNLNKLSNIATEENSFVDLLDESVKNYLRRVS